MSEINYSRLHSHFLSEAQVIDIFTSSDLRKEIADRHRISVTTVNQIKAGYYHKSITSKLQRGAAPKGAPKKKREGS
jgi:hypothetical protein